MDDAVRTFIDTVFGATRRRDAERLLELFGRVTGQPATMWGLSIIGYGHYHYRYASGRDGDAGAAGFSPRKAATSIYLPDGVGAYAEQLARLGEHKAAVGCLYITNLDKGRPRRAREHHRRVLPNCHSGHIRAPGSRVERRPTDSVGRSCR